MNADLEQRVVVATASLPWTAAAIDVEEKVVEDVAGLRRTALVRMGPGARLPAFAHAGCVDVLVLAGELRDQRVTYVTGGYVHEEAAARMVSESGCTLFVKHRPARRRSRHALDTRMLAFEPSHAPGLSQAPLHQDLDGQVVLLRFAPGTAIGAHEHHGGEEFFVLEGELRDELGSYAAQTWVRQPHASTHSVASPRGCLLFTFAHHLR